MAKNEKSIEQASTSALEAGMISGHLCKSEKTKDAAAKEIIRRTTF